VARHHHTHHLSPPLIFHPVTLTSHSKTFQAELLGYENLLDVNHSISNTDNTHFAFAVNKSKAPTYRKKKGPPLTHPKMQPRVSSTYRPHQQTRFTPPQLPTTARFVKIMVNLVILLLIVFTILIIHIKVGSLLKISQQ
jgi:hypothetical protein